MTRGKDSLTQSAQSEGANSPAINLTGPGDVIVTYGEDPETAAQRHHELMAAIARDKGVSYSTLAAILARMGEEGVAETEIEARLASKADEYLALRTELARRTNDRPDAGAARARAAALLDAGDFPAARAVLAESRKR